VRMLLEVQMPALRLPTSRLGTPHGIPWREMPVRLSRLHSVTVRDLKLSPRLSLHHSRHHWAATRLRAGVPLAEVQRQLGHSTPVLTLRTYGAFIASGADREHYRVLVEQDQARRMVQHGS
jgi:integrase